MVIDLDVDGIPVPQGSKRAFYNKKLDRALIVDVKDKTLKEWRTDVANAGWAWRNAQPDFAILDEPIFAEVVFRLVRPASYKSWKIWPEKSADLDKLLRAIFDALTNVLYVNDARIVRVVLAKEFAIGRSAGVHVRIIPRGAHERAEYERRYGSAA